MSNITKEQLKRKMSAQKGLLTRCYNREHDARHDFKRHAAAVKETEAQREKFRAAVKAWKECEPLNEPARDAGTTT